MDATQLGQMKTTLGIFANIARPKHSLCGGIPNWLTVSQPGAVGDFDDIMEEPAENRAKLEGILTMRWEPEHPMDLLSPEIQPYLEPGFFLSSGMWGNESSFLLQSVYANCAETSQRNPTVDIKVYVKPK